MSCANCRSPLTDRYCSRCGQEAKGPPLTAISLAAHFLSRVTGDGVERTIVHLIYLAIAMRSVYGQGWIASRLKAFLELFAFPLMLKARRVSTSLVAPLLA